MRKATILFSLFIGFLAQSQVIKVDCEKRVKDDFFDKSQSIIPVYRYVGKEIEPYTKFGLEIDATKPWYTIKKLPPMSRTRDTGYTYIYFSGADNEINQGYVLTLVGNYRRSRRTVFFFVDRNNDFDFTNDGPPDSLTFMEQTKEIELENVNAPGATYAIKLSRFKYGENVRYKNMLGKHYRNHSGQKRFTDINYCYREQRYNVVAAHYKSETDSFTIGIKDVNVNGIYNESCVDKLYLGPYKDQIKVDKLFDMTPTISKIGFEWNGKKYRFKSIESTGKYIEIVEDKNAKLANKLEIGKKTPNFEYFNILSRKHELKEYQKKPIYLFFWDKESLVDEDRTYLNKLHKEFAEELKLVTLNHGDAPKQVRIMYYYDRIEWPVGYSNSEIGEDYFLEDVSRGYYLGKRRKLLNDNISPKEIYELLKDDGNS